jgi:dimethylargininase
MLMQPGGYAADDRVYTTDNRTGSVTAGDLQVRPCVGTCVTTPTQIIAITHVPSPRMQACERTFVAETTIDLDLARRQHVGYCAVLEECGAEVVRLDANAEFPDAAFVEDAVVVLDEVAIVGTMGVDSRRAETAAIEAAVRNYRPVHRIDIPATLEGGDVLRIGKTLLIGMSTRTNAAGMELLRRMIEPLGYRVIAVPVLGCLHLKTGCSALPDGALLVNRGWIDCGPLNGLELIEVPREEPWGANAALVSSSVIVPANHSRTADLIARRGFEVHEVDISEFQKAEGGVTCLSILVEQAE